MWWVDRLIYLFDLSVLLQQTLASSKENETEEGKIKCQTS